MSKLLDKETRRLEKAILEISALAEESVYKAVKAFEDRDRGLAQQVIDGDTEIDRREVDLEEECLKVLALHQPVASDLRFIVAVLKINNDLERVADYASSIAKRTLVVADLPDVAPPFDLHDMAEKVWTMVRDSVDALVKLSPALAHAVCVRDQGVDEVYRRTYTRTADAIRQNANCLDSYICYLTIARSLERIADHACNIAEDVVYMLQGEIVRHAGADKKNAPPARQPRPGPPSE